MAIGVTTPELTSSAAYNLILYRIKELKENGSDSYFIKSPSLMCFVRDDKGDYHLFTTDQNNFDLETNDLILQDNILAFTSKTDVASRRVIAGTKANHFSIAKNAGTSNDVTYKNLQVGISNPNITLLSNVSEIIKCTRDVKDASRAVIFSTNTTLTEFQNNIKTVNPESASFVSYIENNLNYNLENDDYSADFTINPKEGATDLSLKNSSTDGITIHVTSDGVSSSWKSSNILYKGYPIEYRCLYESTSAVSCTITIGMRLAATVDYYASSPYNNPFSISPALKDPSEQTHQHTYTVSDACEANIRFGCTCGFGEYIARSNLRTTYNATDKTVSYEISGNYNIPNKSITISHPNHNFTLEDRRADASDKCYKQVEVCWECLTEGNSTEFDHNYKPTDTVNEYAGMVMHVCPKCGDTRWLPCEHNFENSVCTICGFEKEINMIKPAISFNSVNKTIENDVNKYDIEINYTESFDVDGQASTGSMVDWSIEVDPNNISTTYQDVLTGMPEFGLDRTYYTDSDNNKFYIKYKARVDQNSLYIDFIGELDGGDQTGVTSVLLDEDFIKTTTKPEKIEFDPDLTETVVNESSYEVSVRIDSNGIGATISFTIQKDSINKGYIEALDDFDDPITFKGLPIYTSLRQEANKIYLDLATFNGTEYSEASTILLEEVKNEPENPTICDCSGNYKVLLETRPATINQPAQYQFIVADGIDYVTESLKEGLSRYVDELGNYKRKQITLVDSLDVNLNTFIGSEEPSTDEAVEVMFDLNQNGFEFFRGCGEAYVEDYRFISWNDTLLDQVLSEIENRFGGTMIVGKYYSIGQIAMTGLTALDPSASIDWESIPSIKLPEGLCRLYNVKTGKSNYISKEIEIKVHLIEK